MNLDGARMLVAFLGAYALVLGLGFVMLWAAELRG